ncbi:flagellar motor switch protein FliG [Pseudaminobacter soli (ex Li et al. 2025)]|uniref:Flagellar motor switch protein FliG n=1 Tax=Pseudaminobacter soli (ex Li et al. 2025) TaxID=1295366 RepID=A0A2P7SDT3_9HYPH|nr:flagellar motor switch protein FliG [Mesorhizobium soli]PSJ60676.1 flagellar motor switch protein FliG [Mesorhizobium soli]
MNTLASLTRAQKAAAILVAMGKPSASRMLKFFKQEELKALIEAARLLRTIPQADLEQIVAEFEAEFMEGAGLLDSADDMNAILTESLSPEEMNAIMGRGGSGMQEVLTPVWPEMQRVDPARVADFLNVEHPQTSAVIMSKLAPSAAANVLLALEKPLRGEILKRMMSMGVIPDSATQIVENQLRSRVLSERANKDISAGQSRVASLLNEMNKDQADEVMRDLELEGTSDLDGIRARMFSFEDVVFLSQKARVALFDGLSTETLTLCLRGAPAELAEAVLSSISARTRRMIESELGQGADEVTMSDVITARRAIASQAIRMSLEGAFELPSAQSAA